LYSRRISPQRLRQWVGLAAFMVALASLLVFAAGASLWHQDSPGTACPICYATHLPAMRSLPAHTPVAATAIVRLVPAELLLTHATPDRLNSPPRAPPV